MADARVIDPAAGAVAVRPGVLVSPAVADRLEAEAEARREELGRAELDAAIAARQDAMLDERMARMRVARIVAACEIEERTAVKRVEARRRRNRAARTARRRNR